MALRIQTNGTLDVAGGAPAYLSILFTPEDAALLDGLPMRLTFASFTMGDNGGYNTYWGILPEDTGGAIGSGDFIGSMFDGSDIFPPNTAAWVPSPADLEIVFDQAKPRLCYWQGIPNLGTIAFDVTVQVQVDAVWVEADTIIQTIPEAQTATANGAGGFAVNESDLIVTASIAAGGVNLNCTCSDPGGRVYRTLKDLRDAIMRRLGWGNQLLNPPPGSVDMINSFLFEAQYSLYMRFDSLRGERYFTWNLQEGVALYGLGENIDDCSKRLNPDKIHWVGVVRPGNLWTTLVAGIPELLNSYPNTSGYPVRYDIRQCIQVWPVPNADAGQLVIKGIFDLLPFADDDDVCTVDDSMVFALALADAKAHYRQPDADRYIGRAEAILNALVAGTHTTRRYIPGNNRGQELVYVQPMPSVPFPS